MSIDSQSFASSSYLLAGVYEDDKQELTITFRDGTGWLYSNVPQGIWEGLKAAGSAGQYFHRQIKGRYAGREV